ncbi:type IV pilin [Methanoculleus bourgensis]|uniref:type IV pilin n=1 Tax=Methanoculleus bourgensis TaxID=83986 RepID=UPI001BDA6E61|nr:type IV pilin [Methanoculleus bourgensis]MBT0733756.1 type IV pilin [Methanoculleus bourgensis]
MTRYSNEEGVSEIIGVMLLVGVTVLAVAVVAVVFLSGPQPDEIPHATIVAGIGESGSLALVHEGGDPLRKGEYRIYVENESGFVDGTGDFTEPEDGVWSIGGALVYNGTEKLKRVVVTAISGGSETILAEPEFRGGGTAGFSPDPVEPGTVSDGGGNGSEETPISIVIPGIGTTMKFVKIGGDCRSFVSANVTNVSVTRVDFIMYDYAIPSEFFRSKKNATWVPGNGTYEWEIEVQYGQIKDVESVVIAAIAFNETDVVGCDAQRMNITVVK